MKQQTRTTPVILPYFSLLSTHRTALTRLGSHILQSTGRANAADVIITTATTAIISAATAAAAAAAAANQQLRPDSLGNETFLTY